MVSAAIPFSEADARIAEFEALVGGDKTKPVVVACGNGSKAVEVEALLLERGFTDVSAQVITDVAAPSPPAP
jgi:3-mercaptopyruvate sulfurtransferase SseA